MRPLTTGYFSQNLSKVLPLADQALVSGTNFLTGIIITKALGLEAFGFFTMGWLVLLFASSIQQAWIIQPMYSLSPKMVAERQSAYYKALYLNQFIFSAASAILVGIFAYFSASVAPSWDLGAIAFLLPAVVFFYLMQDYYRKRFFADGHTGRALAIDVIANILVLAGLVSGAADHWLSLETVWWIFIAGYGAGTVYGIIYQGWPSLAIYRFGSLIRENWKYSGWLIASALLQWFSGNFFIIAAGSLLGPVALGAIRIGQNVLGVLNVVFLAMENKVPIEAAKIYHAEGQSGLTGYLKKVGLAGIILTAAMVILISIFSREIITVVYGTEYASYAWILAGFGIVYLLVSAGMPLRFALRTLERTRDIFLSYVLNVIFSLALANYMVKAFGITGVIAGLAISQLIMSSWYIISLKKKMKLS